MANSRVYLGNNIIITETNKLLLTSSEKEYGAVRRVLVIESFVVYIYASQSTSWKL